MICYFSACFFFLFQAFVPEFSGIFLLGFVIPIFYYMSYRYESYSFLNPEILQPIYFLVYLLIIASFLTICMPNEFLNYLACIYVSYLTVQISQFQWENSGLTVLLFLFTCLANYLSLLESSGLVILSFAFAIKTQNLKLQKVMLFIAILSYFIFFHTFAFSQENLKMSISIFLSKIQVDSILLLGCIVYFLFSWIKYFKLSSKPFYKTDFLFYFSAYLGLLVLNEPIFSVFLFFSSLPMATKRKI
jgi:hypothetical protein